MALTETYGRIFYCWCFFSFFSARNFGAASADRCETFPRDRKVFPFYNIGPKILGALHPKKVGAENVQNLGRLLTTSKFDREYLRNGWR